MHEGLQFMFRFSSSDNQDWQSDLGLLSGGERTLVSLALILAVSLIQPSESAVYNCMQVVFHLSSRIQPCKQDTLA